MAKRYIGNFWKTIIKNKRKKIEKLIDRKKDVVALGACKEVLNKAGYMETQKVEQKLDTVIKVEVIE